MHVGHRHIHAGLHDAERTRGQHRALVVEARHQHIDAAADFTEHVLFRHLAVFEHQFAGVGAAHAELVELLCGGKSFHALFDDESSDAARARRRIGLGVDHERLCDRAVGDPHLAAVDNVAVALLVGAGRHRDHVGTGRRFGHGERSDMLAGNQFRQIFFLLRIAAVAAKLIDAQVGMRAIGQPHRRRRPGNFFHREAMLEIAEARAAKLFLDGNAVQPQRAELGPKVARKLVAPVDFGSARRDFMGREIAYGLANGIRGFAKIKIEYALRVGNHQDTSGQMRDVRTSPICCATS